MPFLFFDANDVGLAEAVSTRVVAVAVDEVTSATVLPSEIDCTASNTFDCTFSSRLSKDWATLEIEASNADDLLGNETVGIGLTACFDNVVFGRFETCRIDEFLLDRALLTWLA